MWLKRQLYRIQSTGKKIRKNNQVNNISEYIPPSYTGKICTKVYLPWHLAGANSIEGSEPPLIGAVQGIIVIDQYDLEKSSAGWQNTQFDQIMV